MTVVSDGRTDLEKLRELLREPEQTALDFKSTVDFGNTTSKLNLVKDLVALSNNPEGGYLLIGVADDGTLSLPIGTITDPHAFDGARIGDLVRKHVEGVTEILSQIHEVDVHEVVMLFACPHADGLPVPMSSTGNTADSKGKQSFVFRQGDLWVREGAQNVPIRHAHWSSLLARHDALVRSEARKDVDALLKRLAGTSGNPAAEIPLDIDMPEEAFAQGVQRCVATKNVVPIKRVIRQAIQRLDQSQAEPLTPLLAITVTVVEELLANNTKEARHLCDELHRARMAARTESPELSACLATMIYVIGSTAVRAQRWKFVKYLSLLPGPNNGGYQYASWIRATQVNASRGHQFSDEEQGIMISAALKLMLDHPTVCPDVTIRETKENNDIAVTANDPALDSLCQFDFLYCVWVAAEGQGQAGGYPASSAFRQERVGRVLRAVGHDVQRTHIFPKLAPSTLADALDKVIAEATRESMMTGGLWWDGLDFYQEAKDFVQANRSSAQA